MSHITTAQQIATELVSKLQGVTDELTIKEITLNTWKPFMESIPNENSFKRPRKKFRDIVETAFPSRNEPKPGYYWTKEGKGKGERYEYLALWYCTTNEERWNVIGDTSRAEYWAKLPKFSEEPAVAQTEPEPQPEPQTEPETELKIGLEDMTLEQLGLDEDTQKSVANLLKDSGINLADFVRQACKVYAKTMEGKAKQSADDLSNVSTEELLNVTQEKDGKTIRTKYFTHPGRAEELVKRAISAIKKHNDNATENDQRWAITQTVIQALTGSRPSAIGKILIKYKDDITTHHDKYKLHVVKEDGAVLYPNRRGKDRKVENEINLIELVPNGIE